jgi:hypothetical protein
VLRVGSRSARTHDESNAEIGAGMLLMNFSGRHDVDIAGADRVPTDQLELGRPDIRWAAVRALIAIHGLAPLDQSIERPDIAMVMHVGDHVRLSDRCIEHKAVVRVFIEQQIANGRRALHCRRPALRALLERRVCEQLSHRRCDLAPQRRLLQPLSVERADIVGELPCRR